MASTHTKIQQNKKKYYAYTETKTNNKWANE